MNYLTNRTADPAQPRVGIYRDHVLTATINVYGITVASSRPAADAGT
jgi:hypothetical protein